MPAANGAMQAGVARKGLAGFFLTGLFAGVLGAILPAWRYHIQTDFLVIGGYFLAQGFGVVLASWGAMPLLRRRGIAFTLALACGVACGGFLVLAGFSPPLAPWWRMLGLLLIGYGGGLLSTAVFHILSPAYRTDPAATVNLAGTVFGLGCLVSSLLVGGTFFVYTVPSILILLALIPGFSSGLFARARFPDDPLLQQPTWQEVRADFRRPVALLFALFLFFQFGNEWAIAGWLTLFLIQKLGVSPPTSLALLSLYWLILLVGRLAGQWVLPRVPHGRLLFCASFGPLLGCTILSFTNNLSGAVAGLCMTAGGYSLLYPLAIERVGQRFPYYHPGFFNGIFSAALAGALLAPATLGLAAHFLGMGVIMGLPLLGTFIVLILVVAMAIERRLSKLTSGAA